jgi:hypothetical protein
MTALACPVSAIFGLITTAKSASNTAIGSTEWCASLSVALETQQEDSKRLHERLQQVEAKVAGASPSSPSSSSSPRDGKDGQKNVMQIWPLNRGHFFIRNQTLRYEFWRFANSISRILHADKIGYQMECAQYGALIYEQSSKN